MAKKRATRGEFNMSAEIRALLDSNADMSGREVLDALRAKFPGQNINENSCNVAFSNARRKLGLRKTGKRTVVRRPRPSAAAAPRAAAVASGNISLDALKAACELVAKAGSTDAALSIVRSLAALNMG